MVTPDMFVIQKSGSTTANGTWCLARKIKRNGESAAVFLCRSLYRSFHGEIAGNGLNEIDNAGYMWECPDLFALDGEYILLCCPCGMVREHERYLNTYPCAATWTV